MTDVNKRATEGRDLCCNTDWSVLQVNAMYLITKFTISRNIMHLVYNILLQRF